MKIYLWAILVVSLNSSIVQAESGEFDLKSYDNQSFIDDSGTCVHHTTISGGSLIVNISTESGIRNHMCYGTKVYKCEGNLCGNIMLLENGNYLQTYELGPSWKEILAGTVVGILIPPVGFIGLMSMIDHPPNFDTNIEYLTRITE